jgi:hypothetical protein
MKNKLFLILNRVSVTMDGWTSISGDPYLSLTCHFINSEWKLITSCLTTMYYPESHTADNLADFVTSTLHDFGLRRGNLVSMTTDSAANMIAAARVLGKFILLLFPLTTAVLE